MQKKDYKAQRLYLELAKAKTLEQTQKAQLKIRDYFFSKREKEST